MTQERPALHTRPLLLFVCLVIIIFIAEALVMVLMPHLKCPTVTCEALVDASLLAFLIAPALCLLFFRPLRKTITRLEQSETYKEQLQEIDQIKGDFISTAAHELCTPVSVVMGYSELLLMQSESETQKEYLKVIYQKTLALERIIDDLTDLSRLEAAKSIVIKPEQNDLIATINTVVHYYRTSFPEHQINLKVPAQTLRCRYDHIRICQVLDNLLSNAIKYSDCVHDEIDLIVTADQQSVSISIKDEGIGMTPAETRNIFKKFYRAKTERSAIGGLGLGMAIVKNIIDGHHGTIKVLSQRGVGTTITLTLPIKSEQGQASTMPSAD